MHILNAFIPLPLDTRATLQSSFLYNIYAVRPTSKNKAQKISYKNLQGFFRVPYDEHNIEITERREARTSPARCQHIAHTHRQHKWGGLFVSRSGKMRKKKFVNDNAKKRTNKMWTDA